LMFHKDSIWYIMRPALRERLFCRLDEQHEGG
jgi:hypothetical protein